MTGFKELYREAVKAREMSYCPYSGFAVGAALLAENGKVYTGCNIENAAYSPSLCAERTAFAKAISEGVHEFRAIAVAGGEAGRKPVKQCTPCGVCRQVMTEFCDPDSFKILLGTTECEKTFSLRDLIPEAFDK